MEEVTGCHMPAETISETTVTGTQLLSECVECGIQHPGSSCLDCPACKKVHHVFDHDCSLKG